MFKNQRFLGLGTALGLVLTVQGQQFTVKELVSDREFCLETAGKPNPEAGKILAIVSHESRNLLGYALVVSRPDSEDCPSQAMMRNQSSGILVRPGNWAFVMNVTQADTQIPGNFGLLIPDDPEASIRYKPMIYLGPILGQTAAVLAPREFILGFGIFGVAPRVGLQLDTTTYMNLQGIPNAGVKARLFSNEEYTISAYTKAYYYLFHLKAVFDFEALLDSYSGSRTASHLKVTVKSRRPKKGILNQEKGERSYTTHFENFYSIMLPGWDRIQVGPRYNVTENLLGAYLGYAILWDRFHFILGAQVENMIRPDFPAINFDFFWRF